MTDTFYDPKIPLRYEIRERTVWIGATRSGSPVAGGRSRKYAEEYKVLQYWVEGRWLDVPEVRAESKP